MFERGVPFSRHHRISILELAARLSLPVKLSIGEYLLLKYLYFARRLLLDNAEAATRRNARLFALLIVWEAVEAIPRCVLITFFLAINIFKSLSVRLLRRQHFILICSS